MSDQMSVYAIFVTVSLLFVWQVLTRRFDPFSPLWLFLAGYVQVYVVQAYMLREWAIGVRGIDVVSTANFRAFWALLWYLTVYHFGPARGIAATLPTPPRAWSVPVVAGLAPVLTVFGLACAWMVMSYASDPTAFSAEAALLFSFPFVTVVAAILMIVTGRNPDSPRPAFTVAGLGVAAVFVALWIFNGKRSPALIGVFSVVCAYYATRKARPSWAVLLVTAFVGSLFVAVAINWRFNKNHHEKSVAGFIEFLGDFEMSSILSSLNIENEEEIDHSKFISYETLEYGGFLLMMDTVPWKSGYDFGANYLRCFSTFIPRIVWPEKPLYGREQWVNAWIAGSEMKRDETFAGPAIGIMGATQLNGGGLGTLIVMAAIALLQRTGYEYFRRYEGVPWVQAWWALTYYCSWFMVVADDPMNWFYYNWGFTTMPTVVLLWVVNKVAGQGLAQVCPAPA